MAEEYHTLVLGDRLNIEYSVDISGQAFPAGTFLIEPMDAPCTVRYTTSEEQMAAVNIRKVTDADLIYNELREIADEHGGVSIERLDRYFRKRKFVELLSGK